jgi:hypothetical protein
MSPRHRLALVAAACLLAGTVSACGAEDTDTAGTGAAEGQGSTSAEPGEDTAEGERAQDGSQDEDSGDDDADAVASGPLPDPCELVSTDELAALLGTDPGEPRLEAPVPDQRATCFYADGTIIGVSAGDIVDDNRASVEGSDDVTAESVDDVDDLGTNAWVANYGGVVQVYATDGTVTVDLTSVSDPDAVIATARSLLDAL